LHLARVFGGGVEFVEKFGKEIRNFEEVHVANFANFGGEFCEKCKNLEN
jgi:hypothetical protein